MMRRVLGAAAALALCWTVPALAGATLDGVKQRGVLACGVNVGVAGFSLPDSQGIWRGMDTDLCRAIAAAVLGDAGKVRFVPLTAVQRFTALQSGEIDVLIRQTTLTMTRDTTLGLRMVGVNLYDGHGFMVRRDSGVTELKGMDGMTICLSPGTTNELVTADAFRSAGLTFTPVLIERPQDTIAAMQAGRCDAMGTDSTALAALRKVKSQAKVSQRTEIVRAELAVPADAAERLRAAFDDLRAAGRVRDLVLVPGDAETETAVLDAELAPAG